MRSAKQKNKTVACRQIAEKSEDKPKRKTSAKSRRSHRLRACAIMLRLLNSEECDLMQNPKNIKLTRRLISFFNRIADEVIDEGLCLSKGPKDCGAFAVVAVNNSSKQSEKYFSKYKDLIISAIAQDKERASDILYILCRLILNKEVDKKKFDCENIAEVEEVWKELMPAIDRMSRRHLEKYILAKSDNGTNMFSCWYRAFFRDFLRAVCPLNSTQRKIAKHMRAALKKINGQSDRINKLSYKDITCDTDIYFDIRGELLNSLGANSKFYKEFDNTLELLKTQSDCFRHPKEEPLNESAAKGDVSDLENPDFEIPYNYD